MDVMSHDDIVNFVSSFYTDEEIKETKQTLYSVMNCEGDSVERQSDAREKNLSDVLRKLRTTPRVEVKFCIANTRR